MIKKVDENLTSSQPWWPLPERQHHHLHKPVTSTEAVAVTSLTQDLDQVTTVCHPTRGGSRIKACTFLTQVEREREREGVEGNPSPVYEVQRGMISYNWGGLEGQGSGESAVHIEPICNTHFNQTCDPPRHERKEKNY